VVGLGGQKKESSTLTGRAALNMKALFYGAMQEAGEELQDTKHVAYLGVRGSGRGKRVERQGAQEQEN